MDRRDLRTPVPRTDVHSGRPCHGQAFFPDAHAMDRHEWRSRQINAAS
ncbi:hypothetical protein OROGR_004012 [Orobanche gracilis]